MAKTVEGQFGTRKPNTGDLKITIHVPLDRKVGAHIDNMIASQVALGLTWGEHIYAMVASINAILAEPEAATEAASVRVMLVDAITSGSVDAVKAAVER